MPIFYLIHGEAFDSTLPFNSYDFKVQKHKINLYCQKCVNKNYLTLHVEFYHKGSIQAPIMIGFKRNTQIFHQLHYEDRHPMGLVSLFPNEIIMLEDEQNINLELQVCNEPLLENEYLQLKKETQENQLKIKHYMGQKKRKGKQYMKEHIEERKSSQQSTKADDTMLNLGLGPKPYLLGESYKGLLCLSHLLQTGYHMHQRRLRECKFHHLTRQELTQLPYNLCKCCKFYCLHKWACIRSEEDKPCQFKHHDKCRRDTQDYIRNFKLSP